MTVVFKRIFAFVFPPNIWTVFKNCIMIFFNNSCKKKTATISLININTKQKFLIKCFHFFTRFKYGHVALELKTEIIEFIRKYPPDRLPDIINLHLQNMPPNLISVSRENTSSFNSRWRVSACPLDSHRVSVSSKTWVCVNPLSSHIFLARRELNART